MRLGVTELRGEPAIWAIRRWPSPTRCAVAAAAAAALSISTAGRPLPPIRSTTATSRSEEHTSELQSLMRISYAVFCLHKNKEYHSQDKGGVNLKFGRKHTEDSYTNC